MDAVVKVYCTHTEPNYSLPWQRKRQFSSTSSGFVVVGEGDDGVQQRYLLTNAHSVEYYSQVGAAAGWVRLRWWAGAAAARDGGSSSPLPCRPAPRPCSRRRVQVKVKKRGDDRKWLAKVLAIGTECDVALLTGETLPKGGLSVFAPLYAI